MEGCKREKEGANLDRVVDSGGLGGGSAGQLVFCCLHFCSVLHNDCLMFFFLYLF